MEFLSEYGLFLAKAITIIVAIAVVIGLAVSASHSAADAEQGSIEVLKLNDHFDDLKHTLQDAVVPEELRKQQIKEEKKRKKEEKKREKKALKNTQKDSSESAESNIDGSVDARSRVFVLDFDGDIKASAVEAMREEITSVLSLATEKDEVIVRLESGGGMVHSYGLASSQLDRIRKKGVPLTVCVDMVAASGGYMMACVADKILAAPFAVLGSIGVVAQLPNFHRLLKKHDVDVELLTAGEHKRTLTMFGENTDKDREKFVEDLQDTHDLFKEFVSEHRPVVAISEVANGDVWFGQRALDVHLVDELMTSDEYILSKLDTADVFKISYITKKTLPQKLGLSMEASVDRLALTWVKRLQGMRFFS